MCIALLGCNARYLCAYGTPVAGLPRVTETDGLLNCAACDSGYKLFDNLCIPTRYTCFGGDPYPGSPTGNADVERCTSCASGTDPDPATELCATEFPYICANGIPKTGIVTAPNTEQCASCNRGFTLSVNGICNAPFRGITYGGVTFYATDTEGNIHTSTTGTDWTKRASGTRQTLNSISYGNSITVAIGRGGTILTSNDEGATWIARSSGTTDNLFHVAFVNSAFFALSREGAILTSSDGISWTHLYNDLNGNDIYDVDENWTTESLRGIAYGNGTYIIVGINSVILTSNDSVSWTHSYNDINGNNVHDGSSEDWAPNIRAGRGGGNVNDLYDIVYANGSFFAVAFDSILSSNDNGVTWNHNVVEALTQYTSIIHANNLFVLGGQSGDLRTSTDGVAWTKRASDTEAFIWDIAYGNGIFVASGQATLITSNGDGITWTDVNTINYKDTLPLARH